LIRPRTSIAVGATAVATGFVIARAARRSRDVTTHRSHASRTVTVRRSAADAFALWRDAHRQFYRGAIDAFTDQRPAERLAFVSPQVGRSDAVGAVTFHEIGARGTEVRLAIAFEGSQAKVDAAVGKRYGCSPAELAAESLRAFKALAETGEIPRAVRQ
jgi:uncharacterized membrane protein